MNFSQKDGPDTRKELTAAACRLFRSKGYDNTTLFDLLELAQVEEHLFFSHFHSLDEILEVVWSES